MTLQDMIDAAQSKIDLFEKRIAEGLPRLVASPCLQLVLPGLSSGDFRRLAGRSGPKGHVLCDNVIDGKECSVVNFDAKAVLKWAKEQQRKTASVA